MGRNYHDDDRPSWREIDRRKDRSSHVSREGSRYREQPFRSSWFQKQYRKEAEKLFSGKKGSEKHRVARNAIYEAHGSPQFSKAVKDYLDEYGLPDDWSTLSLLLDYDDPVRVREAIAALKAGYGTRTTVERQGFRSKLQILAMTTRDEDLREFVQKTLEEL